MTAQTKQGELRDKIANEVIHTRNQNSRGRSDSITNIQKLINSEVLSALDEARKTEQLSWHSINMDDVDSYDSAFEQGVDKQYAKFITKIESIKNRYKL